MRWRQRSEDDFDREVQAHLDLETDRLIGEGMSADEARVSARRRFGNVVQHKERFYERQRLSWLDQLRKDIRYAVRSLRRSPGFSITVLLILALGIGANTALFSGVKGLMLDTLPVADPGTLVRLRVAGANEMYRSQWGHGYSLERVAGERVMASFSQPMFELLSAANETLSGMFASVPLGGLNVIIDGQAELASGFMASGGYFEVVGVRPQIGRAVGPDDDDLAASPVAMISDSFWARRLGRARDVVGRVISVNNVAVTVVGVLPAEYAGVQRLGEEVADLHLPLAASKEFVPLRRPELGAAWWWLQIMGRLKPGVTLEQVRGNLEGPFRAGARAGMDAYLGGLTPAERALPRNRDRTAVPRLLVDSGSRGIYDPIPQATRQALILSIVVGLILLIVCANVANLLLSRSTARQREIAVRLSLGATRARLVRQLLTEGVVLSVSGGALGVLVAIWTRQWLPFGQATSFDWRLFGFVALLSLATGVAFSLVPALRATGAGTAGALKESGRGVVRSTRALGNALIVVQVAVSVVLLVGAGLFLRTLGNLRGVDVGFDAGNVLLFNVNPDLNGYDDAQITSLYERMTQSVRGVPGVRSVSLSRLAFLSGGVITDSMYVQGSDREDEFEPFMNTVSPDFFATLEIPVLAGRVFDARDSRDAPPVALINETAAREFFPGINPIGQRFGSSAASRGRVEIVGVVQDVKYFDVREAAPPTLYWPQAQQRTGGWRVFEVKTVGPPSALGPAVREAVRRVDPTLPVFEMSTQAIRVEEHFSQERLYAFAYSLFGVLAMLLAAIGLFGLASYGVAQRTNEIGIRMALGARTGQVARMVLGESLLVVGVGVGLGIAIAPGAGQLVESLLFEMAPTDALAIAQAVAVMSSAAAVAAYLPARRAAAVDPLLALRRD
jgi:predicted permease